MQWLKIIKALKTFKTLEKYLNKFQIKKILWKIIINLLKTSIKSKTLIMRILNLNKSNHCAIPIILKFKKQRTVVLIFKMII